MTTHTDHTHRSTRRTVELGAALVEYALLLALIAVACVVALQSFGVTNGGSINNTADTYTSAVQG